MYTFSTLIYFLFKSTSFPQNKTLECPLNALFLSLGALRMYEVSFNSLRKVKSIIKLYSRYHFIIKNALRVSRLHNKLQDKTTLKLRKCNRQWKCIPQWQTFAPYILLNYYKLLLITGVQIMWNCLLWNSKDIPNLNLFT